MKAINLQLASLRSTLPKVAKKKSQKAKRVAGPAAKPNSLALLKREIAALPVVSSVALDDDQPDPNHTEARTMAKRIAAHFDDIAKHGTSNGWRLAMFYELATGERATMRFRKHWFGDTDEDELHEVVSSLRSTAAARNSPYSKEVAAIAGGMLDPEARKKMSMLGLPHERHRYGKNKGRLTILRSEMLRFATAAIERLRNGEPSALVVHSVEAQIWPYANGVPDRRAIGRALAEFDDPVLLAIELLCASGWLRAQAQAAISNADEQKKSRTAKRT